MDIAIVSPTGLGGVQVLTRKLQQGLRNEGFNVDLFILGKGVIDTGVSDFKLVSRLRTYDTILYTGSIARSSSVLLHDKRTALFVHGFIKDEYKKTFGHSNIRIKSGAFAEFAWSQSVNMSLFKPDFYICHSASTSNANRLKNSAFLPQFIIPNEITLFESIRKQNRKNNHFPKILAYRSYADSSRLISLSTLVWIARQLTKHLRQKTQFYIIDPNAKHELTCDLGMVELKIIPVMPHLVFLRFLSSADLYIETCTDEEIGLDSVEAGLLEVPLAKITLPQFKLLQDYSDSEVLNATTPETLVTTTAQYLNNLEVQKAFYGEKLKTFLLRKRLWNTVKQQLITELER